MDQGNPYEDTKKKKHSRKQVLVMTDYANTNYRGFKVETVFDIDDNDNIMTFVRFSLEDDIHICEDFVCAMRYIDRYLDSLKS